MKTWDENCCIQPFVHRQQAGPLSHAVICPILAYEQSLHAVRLMLIWARLPARQAVDERHENIGNPCLASRNQLLVGTSSRVLVECSGPPMDAA